MRTKRLAASPMLVLVVVPILATCGDAPEVPRDTRAETGARTPAIDGPADLPGATPAADRPAAEAARDTREDSLRSALRSLLAGPTPEQRAAGARSWFSDTTADALREVAVDGGRVVVDLDGELHELIPNASTSAGSAMLLADLDSVVFGLPWVEAVEYRMGGSCAAFWEWLQRDCAVVTR